jgi:hypothetical protein
MVFELKVGAIPYGYVVGFGESVGEVNHVIGRPDGFQQGGLLETFY